MRLTRIQRLLAELYDLRPELDVERFVCGPEIVRATVGEATAERGEVLLVFEDDEGLHVALYLDPDVLEALREGAPDFRAQCLATEGVSHFLYLTFRADNDEQVTQLELELQAEVDKYAMGMAGAEDLAGNGVGAIRARSRALRERLFHSARYLDDASSAEGERYRIANDAAARYAAALEARYVETGRLSELWVELRRFYRMGARQKLERARSG
ncbi:MAG TPA: hypothetical protein RMH99_13400 [Sandaracinaceae bacterium LLY-WYZ-13_1]|nr:hypothetical protein [Sandaracinaceae bacterium LLY-WYZ-13_1]